MRLFLEGKNGNKDMVLENVKEWNESVHDRKIYVSYEDGRENDTYSMIQYMAVREDFNNIPDGDKWKEIYNSNLKEMEIK